MRTQYFIVCLVAFFLLACDGSDTSSGSSSSSSTHKVNLTGTWEYSTWSSNWALCLERAEGTVVVTSKNDGSGLTIDSVTSKGKKIREAGFGKCELFDSEEEYTSWKGKPSLQSADEYLKTDLLSSNRVKVLYSNSIFLDSYRDHSILVYYLDGGGKVFLTWYRKRYEE